MTQTEPEEVFFHHPYTTLRADSPLPMMHKRDKMMHRRDNE